MPAVWSARCARLFAPALILFFAVNCYADCKLIEGKEEVIYEIPLFITTWQIKTRPIIGIIYDGKEVKITKDADPNDPRGLITLSNGSQLPMSSFQQIAARCGQQALTDQDKTDLGLPVSAGLILDASSTAASGLAVADLNSDGNNDIVSGVRRSSDLTVQLGRDNGTYASAVTYTTGANPAAILLADFDKDGKLDIAAAHNGNRTSQNGHIAVLLGNGDGTFRPAVQYPSGVFPNSLAAADFNGDGSLDLAVANAGGVGYVGLPQDPGSVSVLLGKGDGTFDAASALVAGEGPVSILAADLNNDQKADLLVANRDSGTMSVLRGNGNGTFQPSANTVVGPRPAYLGVSHLNGDALADIVVLHSSTATLSVWHGQANATYELAGRYLTGVEINSFGIAEFEGDLRPYIVAPDAVGTRVLIHPVFLDGTLLSAPAYLTGTNTRSATVADFNGDSELDVVVSASGGKLSLLLGRQGRRLQEAQPVPVDNALTGGIHSHVASGDFNGDGRPDLAVAHNSAGRISIHRGLGDGKFQAGPVLSGVQRPYFVSVLDVNGDGPLDIVSVNQGTFTESNVAVFRGDGNGGFAAPQIYPTGNRSTSVATGDVNGDNRPDLLVVNMGDFGPNKGTLSLLLAKPDGTFQPAVNLPAGESPASAAIADFNGDGRMDIAYSGQSTGAPSFVFAVTVLPGAGNGTFLQPLATQGDNLTGSLLARDFDGNGTQDLMVAHCCGQTDLTLLRGRGDGTFSQFELPGGADPVAMATGDFDKDGRLDVVIVDNAGGQGPGILAILFGDSDPANHVSAASFESGSNPPDSIVSAFGSRLATGAGSTPSPAWPETLAGTTVRVRDRTGVERTAKMAYAGPSQVNYLMPPGTAEGQAIVTITSQDGTITRSRVGVGRIGPGVFFIGDGIAAALVLRNPGGAGEAVEQVVELDANSQLVAKPIDLGPDSDQVVLLLFGTGIRGSASQSDVQVTIGGVNAPVSYAGPQGEFPGLDQINVPIPKSLRGRGLVDVKVAVEYLGANTVKIRVK